MSLAPRRPSPVPVPSCLSRAATALALSAALVLPAAPAARAQSAAPKLQPTEIASKSRTALVTIIALDAAGQPMSQGSGFFVNGNGLLITNLHVIDGGSKLQIKMHTDEIYDTVFLRHADERRDIAILKIPAASTPFLWFGDDTTLQIGERVFAMGNPLGMEGTFSDGLVSARRMIDGTQMIQMTAPISPGSSGGPVLDERGLVIGVSTAKREGGENLNLAVPVHYLSPMLEIPGERAFSASALASLLGRPEPSAAPAPAPASAGAGGGTATARWSPGDHVLVRPEARAICTAHPVGWADGMSELLGRSVEVVQFDPADGTYQVKSPGGGDLWWLPVGALADAGSASASGSGGGAAGDVAAGDNEYVAAVQLALGATSLILSSSGYEAFGSDAIGAIKEGEVAAITVDLERGGNYVFVAVGDPDAKNVDMGVFTPSGAAAGADQEPDATPMVRVDGAQGGTYKIVVQMTACSQQPCAYGVRAFRKN